jgi:DNA-binding transcriptional regulator YiaG
MAIGEVIKKLRKNLHLDQKDFAKLVGVTEAAVCNWENDRRIPRMSMIRKMIELIKDNHININTEDFVN